MDEIESLVGLGFSRYEAQTYAALLRRNPVNGYELAKESGVPRPNIYGILDRLEERGAVMRVEDERGTLFVPVASEELLKRLHSEFERTVSNARSTLSAIGERSAPEPVKNVRGYEATMTFARDLVRGAEDELLLAVWPQEAARLDDDAKAAEERGVAITTLCLAGCPQSCGHCHGRVHRYQVHPKGSGRWLVVVPDGSEMLSAELSDDGGSAARTRQRLLVELAAWYIRHTVAIAAVVKDLRGHEERVLSEETLRILRSIGSRGGNHDWLEEIHAMIQAGESPTRSSSAQAL